MKILRNIARWAIALGIGVLVSLWVFAATLNATVANRDVVKHWLAASGVYDKALTSLLQVSSTSNATSENNLLSIITANTLQQALAKTFDSVYLQQNTNKIIDATYDWLEGKTQAITFSIPVQERADTFDANLAALIKPKLELLPACTGKTGNIDPNHLTCLPPGISATDYAKQIAQPSGDNNFLNAPLTEQAFKQSIPQAPWLPKVDQGERTLVLWLPAGVLVLTGLYLLASEEKVRGLGHVGRQLTISGAVTLIGGLFLWYTSTSIDLTSTVDAKNMQQTAIVTSLINPLARTILPDVAMAFSLYSGIVVIIGGPLWLGAFIWRHKRKLAEAEQPHIPPAASHEAQLPPPTNTPPQT